MRDTCRVTLCRCARLIAFWKVSKSFRLTSPVKGRRLPLRRMLIFLVYMASVSSFYDSFPLFLTIALPVTQTSSSLLPNSVFKNYLHRHSRWSTGNRGRATSASEVIEVAGSNHAIGVIYNLAWGANNFSPNMIWNWWTRNNSQTGIGAE